MPYPLTLTEFRNRFAEFAGTDPPDALVQAKLDEAARRTPESIWGTEEGADAQGYLAAHLLAISPFGRNAKLSNDEGNSVYGAERARLEAELGPAVTPRTT